MITKSRCVAPLVLLLVGAVLFALAGCGSKTGDGASSSGSGSNASPAADKGPITVGSKIDGEGELLGQIIIQALEANGFKVTDRTRTGATDVVRKALLSGEIDVYPEYTANALTGFYADKQVDPTVLKDAARTYETAKTLDKANADVVWLAAAPANNTWAVAVPKAFADANGLATLEDLAAYSNAGKKLKIVGSQEFFDRADAMPGFEKAYGFKLTAAQKVALATGDTAVAEKAAAEGAQGANASMAYGTDGTLAALSMVVLTDTKGVQPIYQPAPTVRGEVFAKYPELATILDPIFAKLDLATLQQLNKEVSLNADAKGAARKWLVASGFVK